MTNVITGDPLVILIEREDAGKKEARKMAKWEAEIIKEAREQKRETRKRRVTPRKVLITPSFSQTFMDPLEIMLDKLDPEKNLRLAIMN
jgi:hypothetical protein